MYSIKVNTRIYARMLFALAIMYPAVPSFAMSNDIYLVQSQFGDFFSCDTMAVGIFLVWWDRTNDLTEEAAPLLDSMAAYRGYCLDSLDMMDPPNPRDGYYFNVYLHENGDVFPDGWSCGVGTDCYGYPYMTLPIGVLGDWMTISHETFHAFQYSSNAPGFDPPDANWYVEATANWFAAVNYPWFPNAFLEAESLVRLPHVPMWLGYANFPDSYPENWQRYVHQYAMALFLFYLTEEEGIPYSLICGGFYNSDNSLPQDLLPQEYLVSFPGAVDMRAHFINWAAHMTNDFDFILPSQKEMAELHWNTYGDPEDDNEFTQTYDDTGSGGWFRPADSLITTAWSFNTYRILNSGSDPYSFHLIGDAYGSDGDPSLFRGKLLVRNIQTGERFYDLAMFDDTEGNLTVDVTATDTELYFIVASMPETFTGVEQTFGYMISVEKGGTSASNPPVDPGPVHLELNSPNPFSGSTTIEFQIPSPGLARLTVYDLCGHLMATLLDEEIAAGFHKTAWDGRDRSGRELPGGVYLSRLEAAGQVAQGKMTILRD